MPTDWPTRVSVLICERERDILNCSTYRGEKLIEHAMKIVENVLQKRI